MQPTDEERAAALVPSRAPSREEIQRGMVPPRYTDFRCDAKEDRLLRGHFDGWRYWVPRQKVASALYLLAHGFFWAPIVVPWGYMALAAFEWIPPIPLIDRLVPVPGLGQLVPIAVNFLACMCAWFLLDLLAGRLGRADD